jgi:hypothetical protein
MIEPSSGFIFNCKLYEIILKIHAVVKRTKPNRVVYNDILIPSYNVSVKYYQLSMEI